MTIVEVDGQQWCARDGDIEVGRARLWCVHARKYRIDLVVEPAHRRHGHGKRLLAHVLDVARREGARSVQVRPMAEDAWSIAFAGKHGFVETMRMFHLSLVLAEARHDELRELMDRLAGESIAIVTLEDFAARARDARRAYLDVIEAAREGWPEADPDLPGDARTVVDWSAIIGDAPEAIVAEQRGKLVGFTSTIGTGVRPELRGRGIATALKVAWIDAALARGETTLTTATGHPAMRHINQKLGYRETRCEVRMVLRLV